MKLQTNESASYCCSSCSSNTYSRPMTRKRSSAGTPSLSLLLVVSALLCSSSCPSALAFDVRSHTPPSPPHSSFMTRHYAPEATADAPVTMAPMRRPPVADQHVEIHLQQAPMKKQKVAKKVELVRRKKQQQPIAVINVKPTKKPRKTTSPTSTAPTLKQPITSRKRSVAPPRAVQEHNDNKEDAEGHRPTKKSASVSVNIDIDPEKLLTKEEEINYAYRLRTMRMVIRMRDELVKQVEGMYIHPTEQEWAAACGFRSVFQLRQVMTAGQQARSILCSANVGLVTSLAKRQYANLKYATQAGNGSVGTIMTVSDLIQEGNLGLMEAAERFDPTRGFRFSTYAVWWIRQRILRSIRDSSRTIRLPAHVHGMLHKIRKARVELSQEQQSAPTVSQIARKLDLPVEKVLRYTESSRNVISLEVPVLATRTFKQDLRTLGDTLASDAPTPDEDAEAEYLRADVWNVIHSELSVSERQVILHRFGFLSEGKPRSVAQTAALLELTADRVRLMEARALNKLRHPQKNYRLREYVNSASAGGLDYYSIGGGGSGGGSSSGSSTTIQNASRGSRGGLIKQRRHMRTSSTAAGAVSNNHHPASTGAGGASNNRHKVTTIRKVQSSSSSSSQQGATVTKQTVPQETTQQQQQHQQQAVLGPRPDRMWFF